jgi:hypothetical protein
MRLLGLGKIEEAHIMTACGSKVKVMPDILGTPLAVVKLSGDDDEEVNDDFPPYNLQISSVYVKPREGRTVTTEDVGCDFIMN